MADLIAPTPGLPRATGGVAIAPTPGIPSASVPASQPGAVAGQPVGLFEQELARLPEEDLRATLVSETPRGRFEAQQEEQKRLEEEYGAFGTAALQGARGALDALLAPGALLGAGIEAVGASGGQLLGINPETLQDFGRDLGESAQGREALAAIAFGGTGGDVDAYDTTKKWVSEQEKAYPLLSAATRLAGAAAPGVLTGGAGLAGSSGKAALLTGGIEGAGFGAQAAFENNASTNELLASTIMSGLLGAGLAKGAQLAGSRLSAAKEAFGDGSVAGHLEAAGARETAELAENLTGAQGRILKKMARARTAKGQQNALKEALADEASILAKKAGRYDPKAWATKDPNTLQKLIYRSELLTNTSDDISKAASKMRRHMADEIDVKPKAVEKILKSSRSETSPAEMVIPKAKEPALASKLGSELNRIAESAPHGEFGQTVASRMSNAAAGFEKKTFAQSFSEAHELLKNNRKLIGELDKAPESIARDQAKDWLAHANTRLEQVLGSDDFGLVGVTYRRSLAKGDDVLSKLEDARTLRQALRAKGEGGVVEQVKDFSSRLEMSHDARSALSGKRQVAELKADVKKLNDMAERARKAVTIDGASFDVLAKLRGLGITKEQLRDSAITGLGITAGHAIGGPIGAFISSLMIHRAHVLLPELVKSGIKGGIKGGLKGAAVGVGKTLGKSALAVPKAVLKSPPVAFAGRAATSRPARILGARAVASLTVGDQKKQYDKRLEDIETVISSRDLKPVEESLTVMGGVPFETQVGTSLVYQAKLAQLHKDLPRPVMTARGPLPLSASDVRLGNAMYEATVDPLSVFEDFAAGSLDQDKVDYAWKQWPGLKRLATLAVQDMLYSQMDDADRAAIPDKTLTKLDYMLQMNGQLQQTISAGFSARIDDIQAESQDAEAEASRQAAGRGVIRLPQSQGTFTENIAGA